MKPQNMALNSAVTEDGGEIGRAQALQAQAAGVEPHTDMNPVLIKPSSDTDAQIIIHGKVRADMNAREYDQYKTIAMGAVLESYARLQTQYDAIIVDLGVDLVGAVDGHVAVALHQHPLVGRRHRRRAQTLALQVQHHHGVFFQVQDVQGVGLGGATSRVAVDLLGDQLLHAVYAVTHHPGRFAPGGRHHLAAHHQQAVLVAGNAALHQHLAAMPVGQFKRGAHIGFLGQVQGHAAAVVAVAGLDHHRRVHVLRSGPGLIGTGHHHAFGHRHHFFGLVGMEHRHVVEGAVEGAGPLAGHQGHVGMGGQGQWHDRHAQTQRKPDTDGTNGSDRSQIATGWVGG